METISGVIHSCAGANNPIFKPNKAFNIDNSIEIKSTKR